MDVVCRMVAAEEGGMTQNRSVESAEISDTRAYVTQRRGNIYTEGECLRE